MAVIFSSESQWNASGQVYPGGDILVAIPDGFTGSEGHFRFKTSDGSRGFRLLRWEPNSGFFQITPPTGSTLITNTSADPVPVEIITPADLATETVQTDGTQRVRLTDGTDDAGLSLVSGQYALKVDVIQTVGSGGGGGAVTVADGADVAEGAVADAMVAAGAAGTVSGKLRRLTNDIAGMEAKMPNLASGRVPVDGSGVTQPVSATTLPLPSGAATAALQTQPGVDIGDVTVNNGAAGAAVNIQDGGNSITVDGPLTDAQLRAVPVPVSGIVATGGLTDAELRAAPVPVSAASLPLPSGASTLGEQQTQTTALQIIDDWDESDRAKVNIIAGQAGVAAGTGVDGATVPRVTLATNVGLPAGANILGKTYIAYQVTKALTNASVSASSSGENTLVAGTASQTIRVFKLVLVCAGPVSVSFKDAAGGTVLTGAMSMTANGAMVLESNDGEPLFVSASSGAFILNLSAAVSVTGFIQYTKS